MTIEKQIRDTFDRFSHDKSTQKDVHDFHVRIMAICREFAKGCVPPAREVDALFLSQGPTEIPIEMYKNALWNHEREIILKNIEQK